MVYIYWLYSIAGWAALALLLMYWAAVAMWENFSGRRADRPGGSGEADLRWDERKPAADPADATDIRHH